MFLINKKVLLFLLIICGTRLFGQVNLQTGSATFSLPIFNWQDNKSKLNLAVAINYSSNNGLKVSDIASNIGQGWSLLAGGIITRIQAGEPDDQLPRDGTPEDETKYPPGYLYNPTQIALGSPISLTRYPIYKDKNHIYKQHNVIAADRELDHFAFQFNGRSGIFALGKPGNNVVDTHRGQAVILGDSKLIITFTTVDNMTYNGLGVRTTISSFTILDENGLMYKFSDKDYTKVLKRQYCDKDLNPQTQPKFKNDKVYHEASFDDPSIINPYVVNGWYLTEIQDTLTHRKINFTYEIRHINTNAGISIADYRSNSTGFATPEKNYSVISHTKSISETPYISSITFDSSRYLINFVYGADRVDLAGDKMLSSINILYQSRYLSKYQLTSSYFILNRYGKPVSDYQKQCARLCLRSIKKIGVDLKADDPPYKFDYFLGSSNSGDFVPPPFFHLKDMWGYYNGDNSKNNDGQTISPTIPLSDLDNNALKGLCFYNGNIFTAKVGYPKNGLLRQITYPTGGSLNYDYAQNTGILIGQNTANNVGGVHVSSTSLTDGGYSNDCNHPITTSYSYVLTDTTQSSLWGLEVPKSSLTIYNHYLPESKFIKGTLFPPSVGCDFRYKYPGILSIDQAASVSMLMQLFQFAVNVYSTISTAKTIMAFISSGDPVTLIIQIVVDFVLSCIGDHHVDNTTDIFYNSDLNGSNPLPSQFKRVEVKEGSTNGKTVYEFTSTDDYALWTPNNPTLSSEQRFAFWAYGLPKKITVYNATGDLVKQNENVYDYTNVKDTIGNLHFDAYYGYANSKALVTISTSEKNPDWENPDNYNPYNSFGYPTGNFVNSDYPGMSVRMYMIYRGRLELSTSYERMYKPASSQYLETVTNYFYNQNNYQVKEIKTTLSNGDQSDKTITYSCDYSDGILNTLKTDNILNIPVTSVDAIIKNGGSKLYLSEKVTEFTQVANGDIKPSRILEQRFTQPQSSITIYQGPSGNNQSYHETQTFNYGYSNLTGIKDEGNHTVSNIYDYDDKYVVASVVNADPNLDRPAYSSFENDNSLGGWALSGTAVYSTSTAITGARSFSLNGSNSLSASNLNTAKGYRLSFWSTNSITVTGNATLIKSSPVINGFTYYEYNIALGTTTVSISGTASVDELRICPQMARMRTVTYDPLIGKTSECDENNRITYYEYDDNSRLRFIKDENKNVVKMYEYNIAKKATGCPVVYTNLAVSEIFIKNCGSGYLGGSVTYTIAAGTYTSTISQDIVDQQVQNDLNTFGQAFANTNGTCTQLFYNVAMSQTFTKQGCDTGYEGTSITYTVSAGKYKSTISQADANQQAQDEIDANGQAFVNKPGNANCVISHNPVWIGTGNELCQNGHKLVEVIDRNPNSSTYNQTQWIDTGENPACGGASCNSDNCNGEGYRCVADSCELGYPIYTGERRFIAGQYYCVFHYEWSDGYVDTEDHLMPVGPDEYCPTN